MYHEAECYYRNGSYNLGGIQQDTPFCTNGSESAGERNIPTIGLGPGNERDAHIVDESISVEQLKHAVTVYRNLVLNIAGGENGDQQ